MPATGEWCAPTAELSATQLGSLVEKTRRDTAVIHALEPTPAAAAAAAAPPPERLAPAWTAATQRHPREAIRKISGAIAALARPVVYPIAPSSRSWLLPVLALVVCAAVAAAYVYS